MKIKSKYAILIIEDEDGKLHTIDKVDLQQDSRVVCCYGEWFIRDNPDIPEEPHDTEMIKDDFRYWLDPEAGETFWRRAGTW